MVDRIQELRRRVAAEFARDVTSKAAEPALPEEVEEGNVEYKLQLLEPSAARLKQLTTQLHWRLNEGRGTAFYEVGVRDNGDPFGLSQDAMLQSLATLNRMCQVAHAEMAIERFRNGHLPSLRTVRVRMTRVLEKNVRKHSRVSVIGDVASGKSTLIGVLTRGCLDDGHGLARMQVFRHRHELENGCTSSLSEHTIGITQDGRLCCADEFEDFGDDDDEDVHASSSEAKSFLTLSDLAGHKKYFKVTASGLASQFPDYAMLVVDATTGVQPMTCEHLTIAVALEVAVFVVLTKTDLASSQRIEQTMDQVADLMQTVSPQRPVALATSADDVVMFSGDVAATPLFQVSSVDGCGLDVLQAYLAALEPKRIWSTMSSTAPEFQINQAYDIEDTGTVVTGLVQSGSLVVGENMLLGPDSNGQFCAVEVESIEVQRKAVHFLTAGETGALLLRLPTGVDVSAARIRKGTMLIHPSLHPRATLQFDAEVHFLPHAPAIRENYQAVIHAGQVRQMAKLVRLLGESNASVAPATTLCRFEFMYWPEYVRPDLPLVLREGHAQGVGKVVRAVVDFRKEQTTSVRSC